MKEEKKYIEGTKIEDLTGRKFNEWTVIEFDWERYNRSKKSPSKCSKHYWKCLCSCEHKTIQSIDRYTLINGKSTRCRKCFGSYCAKRLMDENAIKGYTFENWCLDNDHQDYLDLWDYELNDRKPNEIVSGSNLKFYFKCPRNLHKSKKICISKITNGRRVFCNECNSFGQYLLDNYGDNGLEIYWSNKNKKSPFKISKKTDSARVWIKCENGTHDDYVIRPDVFCISLGCPKCTRENKESRLQKMVSEYIREIGFNLLNEYDCNLVPRNPKTNRGLPFDNEIESIKLIIEVHGKQHYERANWHRTASKRNGTTEEYEFHKRRLYDRYKSYIAYVNGYHYLEIPYWTEEDESYRELINNKIKEIL